MIQTVDVSVETAKDGYVAVPVRSRIDARRRACCVAGTVNDNVAGTGGIADIAADARTTGSTVHRLNPDLGADGSQPDRVACSGNQDAARPARALCGPYAAP